jgi:transposase
MGEASRIRSLTEAGLVHPHADAVRAPLFVESEFFLAADKVQVKYEMLRAHVLDGCSVTEAASTHGYSRAGFYLIASAFERTGMAGLLDDKRGRRGPVKLSPEILAFVQAAPSGLSGAAVAEEVKHRFGVELHRRTVERVRR